MGREILTLKTLGRARPSIAALIVVLLLSGSNALVAFAAVAAVDPSYNATTAAAPFPGPSPLGVAVDTDGTIYSVGSNGQLYVTGPTSGGVATAVGPIGNSPSGIALLGGTLYAARRGTGTNGDVVAISKTTGAPLGAPVAVQGPGLACAPDGIAADATSGNLFVTSPCPYDPDAGQQIGYVFKVNPAVGASNYGCLGQSILNLPHGISVGPEGTIFVQDLDRLIRMAGVTASQPGQCATVASRSGANGIALVGVTDQAGTILPKFVFVTDTAGDIWKINVLTGTGQKKIASGGGTGSFETIGPDNCLYASQATGVTKVTKADGTCFNLGEAGETLPAITLFRNGANPVVGSTAYNITATVTNAPLGSQVTFSRTPAVNPGTTTANTISTGVATTQYVGLNVGTDTVTARVVVAGSTYVSNTIAITWEPMPDTSAPIISATVTGGHADVDPSQFGCTSEGVASLLSSPEYVCGYYTSPPTITWFPRDPESGIDWTKTTCETITLTTPGPPAGTPITCTATNTSGYQARATILVNLALKAPTIAVQSAKYANGDQAAYPVSSFTNRPVTVIFACDGTYGAPFLSCTTPGGTQTPSNPLDPAALPLLSTITFTDEGTYNPFGTVRDRPGRTATTSFGPVHIDLTPPVVTNSATVGGAAYTAGAWTNQPVTVTFVCTDAFSGVAICPAAQTIAAEGAAQTATGQSTDKAGNVSSSSYSPINIDLTKPVITATYTNADLTPYTPGTPTNQAVTIRFTCTDQAGLSGVLSCPADIVVPNTAPGPQTPAPVTATDRAGNVGSFTPGTVLIDTTAPTIVASATIPGTTSSLAYTGVWTNKDVTVTFSCTDAVVCSAPVTLTASTPLAGTPVTGTARDAAGNVATSAPITVYIDKIAPTITATPDRPAGASGWYNGPVTFTFACADTLSGVVACPSPVTVSGSGTALPVSGSVSDNAGNSATFATTIKIETVPPTITGAPTTLPNANGWWKTDVTVVFTCSDAGGSGIASCGPTQTFGQGAGQVATGTAVDGAGNTATATVPNLNVDKVAPTLQKTQTGDTVNVTTTDDLSGVQSLFYEILGANGAVLSSGTSTGSASVLATSGATFRYTITDLAGNVTVGNFPLVPAPPPAPTLTCGAVKGTGTLANGAKVQVDVTCDGKTVKGKIEYQVGRTRIVVTNLTGFTMTADKKSATISGKTSDGKPVVVTVTDSKTAAPDTFDMRVNGAPLGGSGPLKKGNLTVNQPSACGKRGDGSSDGSGSGDSDENDSDADSDSGDNTDSRDGSNSTDGGSNGNSNSRDGDSDDSDGD